MTVTKLVAGFLRYFADRMDAEVENDAKAETRIVIEHLHVGGPLPIVKSVRIDPAPDTAAPGYERARQKRGPFTGRRGTAGGK